MSAPQNGQDGHLREHEFENELPAGQQPAEKLPLDQVLDVNLEVTAELGQCELLVRDILELRKGSVLPLNKQAGEMADIHVNGLPLARGEVVVLVDSLHVRIAEIIGLAERDILGG